MLYNVKLYPNQETFMPKNAMLSVRIERSEHDKLLKRARRDGISYSDAVRILIREYTNGTLKITSNQLEIKQ